MIQKFKKKPIEIEAIQWNGNTNKKEIDAFVGRTLNTELESETAYLAGVNPPIFSLLIETKEGVMKAFKGDWIIKEPFPTGDRDFYPCKNEICVNTYHTYHTIRCPSCGSENEYSQGFKQNIQPVDGGDFRHVCFNICDRCGHAIDVWFWD